MSGAMTLIEHIAELRRRLIVSLAAILLGAIGSFVFYQNIISLLAKPFEALGRGEAEEVLFVNTVFEAFLVKIKVALLSGVVASLPVHVFNLLRFVVPGLTRRERRGVVAAILSSSVLAVFGVYYGYTSVIPVSVAFLTAAGFVPDRVGLLLSFGSNVFYVLRFLLVTLLLFQVPVVLEVLMALQVLSRRALLKASRIVIVVIFVVSAVVTPPDFISQLGLALPMIALFFLTLLVAKVFRFGER